LPRTRFYARCGSLSAHRPRAVPTARLQRGELLPLEESATGTWGPTELKELRQLRDENARLNRSVADLAVDKHLLTTVVQKNSSADTTARARTLDMPALSDPYGSFVSASRAFKNRLVRAQRGEESVSTAVSLTGKSA
jgi:hypothetical protein